MATENGAAVAERTGVSTVEETQRELIRAARAGELAVMDSELLAEYVRLQPRTVRGYITDLGFPSYQVAERGQHLFRKDEVDAWLRLRGAGVNLVDAMAILRKLVAAEEAEDADAALEVVAAARKLVEKADAKG